MSSDCFTPEVLRVYCSEANLPNFISKLEITCQFNIAADYRDDDVFNISPYHIPVFLKPSSRKLLGSYCQDHYIALDLSKDILENYRGTDIYSFDLKGRITPKKINQISDKDFILFFPVLIPFSFVEDIYYEDADRMNNALLGGFLKEDIHFFNSFEKKIQSKDLFSESPEKITINKSALNKLPDLEGQATEIHKSFDAIRAIIYSLLDLRETPDLLSKFLYALYFGDKFELTDILSTLLSENENLLQTQEATKVINKIVSSLFVKGKIDKDIINEIFTEIVGQNVSPKTFKKLSDSTIRFVKKLDLLNDLFLSNISSDDFYITKDNSNTLQSLGMLHLFGNFDVYSKSRGKKGKLLKIVKQCGKDPLHIYLALLGLTNGCSDLIIDEEVYINNNNIFDHLILSFLCRKFKNFYSVDDSNIDRITFASRILENSEFKFVCNELFIYQDNNSKLIKKLESEIKSLKSDKQSKIEEIDSLKNEIKSLQDHCEDAHPKSADTKAKEKDIKDSKETVKKKTDVQKKT